MLSTQIHEVPGYETVIEGKCSLTGLHAFIAIHNTTLGPALGGVRFYPYKKPEDAFQDVLRLSKAMTYKSSVIQDGLGGGKSVIIGDPRTLKTEALLFTFAELLNQLEGRYIAAEDVGMNVEDIMTISRVSPYVAGLATETSCGDPSRFTAHGVKKGIEATAAALWGNPSLKGKTIVVQGLGNVGSKVAELLFWDEARLLVADPDPEKVKKAKHEMGAEAVSIHEAHKIPCDIFSPNALGGILNETSIPELRCQAVAGGANNQLASPKAGQMLFERGILYAPDFVINAGGIINAAAEFEPNGYDPLRAREQTLNIYKTLATLFAVSKKEHKPTFIAADEMAERNLKEGIGKRIEPIRFNLIPSSHDS
jgi:leucine dehydrogenase